MTMTKEQMQLSEEDQIVFSNVILFAMQNRNMTFEQIRSEMLAYVEEPAKTNLGNELEFIYKTMVRSQIN
jgi:hypothetical protein